MPSKNTVGGLKNGDTMLVLAFCASVPSARFFESLTFCLFVCCLQVQVRVSCGGKLSEMDEANAARLVESPPALKSALKSALKKPKKQKKRKNGHHGHSKKKKKRTGGGTPFPSPASSHHSGSDHNSPHATVEMVTIRHDPSYDSDDSSSSSNVSSGEESEASKAESFAMARSVAGPARSVAGPATFGGSAMPAFGGGPPMGGGGGGWWSNTRDEFKRDGTFDFEFDTDKEDHSCMSAFTKEHLHHLSRKLTAEAIGVYFMVTTFGLVNAQGLKLAPIAVACMVMAMIYSLGHISGAHFNPAVTLGFVVRGRMCLVSALAYVTFQFLGGGAAAAINTMVLSDIGRANMTCVPDGKFKMCGIGYPVVNQEFQSWVAILFEAAYSFALTSLELNLEYQDYDYFFAGVARFGWYCGSGIAAAKLTGACFNPVVGVVLPLANNFYRDIPIYVFAPFLGSIVAGLVFRYTCDPHKLATEDHRAKYIFGNMRLFDNNPPDPDDED